MKNKYTSASVVLRLWSVTAFIFALIVSVYFIADQQEFNPFVPVIAFLVSLGGSLPALVALFIALPLIKRIIPDYRDRIYLLILLQFFITIPYGLAGGLAEIFNFSLLFDNEKPGFFFTVCVVCGSLFFSSLAALLIALPVITGYFTGNTNNSKSFTHRFQELFFQYNKLQKMETQQTEIPVTQQPNKILIKGLITGGLILIMMIPTLFITNLVTERETRQKEVVKEVSSKWAAAQTLSGPFLVVPYTDTMVTSDGKTITNKTRLILLADELVVNGNILPEERPRSIYKVLLYKTAINMQGAFKVSWPVDINLGNIDFNNARLCFSLSDFKGIEEEIRVVLKDQQLLLTPGLPVDDFGTVGLSVPVRLDAAELITGIPFSMQVKIKGSEQLHFIPMSATSKFQLNSKWPSPSFDGDMLPNERNVADSGFSAKWSFNQANLPFATVMKEKTIHGNKLEFGVSLVQPADQYNKTMRSVKYAILFIGLTFAFFFVIELLQKKPFHPVQYLLVGLALVIFYSLLLSFSEYILFDKAYFIAALATILLISSYAKSHFHRWATAGIFFGLLSCLYGFIFILISLEDTALLVGSIGLFIVLALVMYASRKINWYGTPATPIVQSNLLNS